MLFSAQFNVTSGPQDDWFDPILDTDTALFVDPFLIFDDADPAWSKLHAVLIKHFDGIFKDLAKSAGNLGSPFYQRAIGLLTFKEPEAFCLGHTSSGVRGAGGGHELAKLIARAMRAAIQRGTNHLDHFEMLGVFNKGIGPDRIGDLTCTILKESFVRYTEDVAKRHKLATQTVTVEKAGTTNDRWYAISADLPINPFTGEPVILVPERFLRRLPTLHTDDLWDYFSTKANLNITVTGEVDKDTIIKYALTYPKTVEEWVKLRKKAGGSAYDLDEDPDLVWKWEPVTREYADLHPVSLRSLITKKDFNAVIDKVVEQFIQFIENEKGWKHLWNEDGTERHEEASQNLFRGIAKHYCNANNIAIDREVNLGRGPVDFKFSQGAALKTHLEVKKVTSGGFWHGLDSQLPDYLKSDETRDGWYVAIQLRSGGVSKQRVLDLPDMVDKASKRHKVTLHYAVADGRPKRSASKKQA